MLGFVQFFGYGYCVLWEEQHLIFPLLKSYVRFVNKIQLVLCTPPDRRDAFVPLHLSLYFKHFFCFSVDWVSLGGRLGTVVRASHLHESRHWGTFDCMLCVRCLVWHPG